MDWPRLLFPAFRPGWLPSFSSKPKFFNIHLSLGARAQNMEFQFQLGVLGDTQMLFFKSFLLIFSEKLNYLLKLAFTV